MFRLKVIQYFCKDYIKKYEMGESYSTYDAEDKCPVISLGKPERMRTIRRPVCYKMEDITVVQ